MANPQADEALVLDNEQSIVLVRQAVRNWARKLGFSLVDQTKFITAASELARNCVIHGGGGRCYIHHVQQGGREGLRLLFEDDGPGIPDIEQALQDGFTTIDGLGLGLGGTRRLVHEFDIRSRPGEGTKITVLRWR